jgi:hypothetical protein
MKRADKSNSVIASDEGADKSNSVIASEEVSRWVKEYYRI